MVGVLTAEQADEYWLTVRRDWYWWDLGLPWDDALRCARRDWVRASLKLTKRQDEPQAFASVLDRINSIGGELYETWAQWKANHPEVFGQNQEL